MMTFSLINVGESIQMFGESGLCLFKDTSLEQAD